MSDPRKPLHYSGMLTALTRAVSSRINECELTFIDRQAIDYELAIRQHKNYQQLLRSLGLDLIELPADDRCPDCCFIEDTALILDELAIATRPRSNARRAELDGVLPTIAEYRDIVHVEAPATLEAGDVLRIGRNVFIGITSRTNRQGIDFIRKHAAPYGYKVHGVEVPGALHLKSVCTAVNERTILADSSRIDIAPFAEYELIEVPPDEWMAANLLLVNGTVCMHAGFHKTLDLLQDRNIHVRTVDISEFLKAEAGLTCMSIIFEAKSVVGRQPAPPFQSDLRGAPPNV
ncbi:MAG: dimethylarginine dimethylaminohydrolase family protein [Terriglobales bacterium]